MRGRIAVLSMVLMALAASASAQRAPAAALQRTPDSAVGRAGLEGAVRRGFARMVRQRVGLSDRQMSQLSTVTTRYEGQRRALQMEERSARTALRDALRNEQTADPGQVDRLLQKMLDVQKQRVALVESEQRELATFMTPIQRARYLALQEQVRRRLEQLQQRRMQPDDSTTPRQITPRRPLRRPLR
jgi:hypothetical protein